MDALDRILESPDERGTCTQLQVRVGDIVPPGCSVKVAERGPNQWCAWFVSAEGAILMTSTCATPEVAVVSVLRAMLLQGTPF